MQFTRTLLLTLAACLAFTPAANAAVFRVTGTADGPGTCTAGDCTTLRAAVAAVAAGDTIELPGGTYALASQLTVGTSVTITGAGARTTTVAGDGNTFRPLAVPTGTTVSISGVTLRDGAATPLDPLNGGFRPGGVVLNQGALTLTRVHVTGGTATSGGGIANVGGTLTVNQALITGNNGGQDAGGLLNFNGGTVVVRNTTLFGNTAAKGGGYYSWGDFGSNNALFEHVTLAYNTAGGIGVTGTDVFRIRNSIVAGNSGANCSGTIESLGGNVDSGATCPFGVGDAGTVVSDGLENLGGDTDVLAPTTGSPARDVIPAAQCLATDQRGITRPIGAFCDAGAVEAGSPPGPVIQSPAQDSYTNDEGVTLTGLATPGADIEVFRNGERLGATIAGDLSDWEFDADLPATDGPVTFGVKADGSEPTLVRIFVDRTDPTTTIFDRPPATTNRGDVTFTFSANEPGATYVCGLSGTGISDPAPRPCTPAGASYSGLGNGAYEFSVRATDRAGNVEEVFATYQFAVNTELIATPSVGEPVVEPSAATLTFATPQPDRTFRCRLEGPGQDGAFAPCASPQRYDGLAAGDYAFTVRSSDAAGNFADSVPRTFSVAGPLPAQPTPTPTPTPTPIPTPTPTPVPTVGEDVVIRPTGKVLVKQPGSNLFVEVKSTDDVPLGSEIDTKNGRVVLRFETEKGKVQTGTFYGGIFKVTQVGKILDLKLTEPLAACPKQGKAAAAQSKKAKKRKLWGDGKGAFRTSGKYSAATVRGTKWLVEDSCAGTLTRVSVGVVEVKYGKKKRLVRAGKQFLVKPPR